jgi:small-conductance mechanosensitive channel
MIVPNSQFITERVTNWSRPDDLNFEIWQGLKAAGIAAPTTPVVAAALAPSAG